MAGGIWEAIGAALQQGSNTYRDASQQQLAQRRAEQQMKLQQEEAVRAAEAQKLQMEMTRQQMAQQQDDRQQKIIQASIEHAQPDDTFTDDQMAQATKFGLGGMMQRSPSMGAQTGSTFTGPQQSISAKLGEDTSPQTMDFLRSRGLNPDIQAQKSTPLNLQVPNLPRKLEDLTPVAASNTRRFSPAEEAAQAQQVMLRDVFKGMNAPAAGPDGAPTAPGALPTEAKSRLGLSMIPGVNPNEVLGPISAAPNNPFAGTAMGEDVLKSLSPQEANAVKMMANYDLPVPGGNMRSPPMMRLLNLAAAYDPSFDATNYLARQKVRNDFTSGGVANNIMSLNTTLNHMAKLSQAAGALNNFGSPAVNAPVNYVEQHVLGDKRVTNYNTYADAVATEAAKVFKGGMNAAPAEKEIQAWKANLSPNMSPEQFQGAMESLAGLLEGRLTEIQTRWTNAFGDKPLPFQLPSIHAQGSLQQMGIGAQPTPNGGPKLQVTGGQPAAAPQAGAKVFPAARLGAFAASKGVQATPANLARLQQQLEAEGWAVQ